MNLLVPVSTSRSNEDTIAYAAEQLRTAPDAGALHLVYTATLARERFRDESVDALLQHSADIARERAGETVTVNTSALGRERYLAGPHDHAEVLAAYAHEVDIDRVVLDPNYTVDATDSTLQSFEAALTHADLTCECADVPTTRFPNISELARFGIITALTFVFWIVVTAPLDTFAIVTGFIGAILAAVLFRNITFEITPRIGAILSVFARATLFVPYFLGKILVANIQISYLVLHPSLPIDPHLDRYETRLPDGLSITGLANSLTLTPGTLTVDAVGETLLVHSITEPTRLEVLQGDRLRAIQFVFFGRNAMEQPAPPDTERAETIVGARSVEDLTEGSAND